MALDFSHVVISVPLVTLQTAKRHLKVTDTYHDDDVTQKTAAAQDALIRWLGTAADATWTDATVPQAIQQAILLLLTAFYEQDAAKLEQTWTFIGQYLGTSRDPTVA